jgi:hypothetical protein
MNRPGESGDSGCCLASLGEGGILTVIGGPEFGRRNVTASLVEPPVVEPVDVLQSGKLDLRRGAPGPRGLISSVLNKPITDSARALS